MTQTVLFPSTVSENYRDFQTDILYTTDNFESKYINSFLSIKI